jgi:hypothetical protein
MRLRLTASMAANFSFQLDEISAFRRRGILRAEGRFNIRSVHLLSKLPSAAWDLRANASEQQ